MVAHSASGILLPDIAAEVGASHLVWLAAVIPDLTGGRSLVEQITTDGAEIFYDEWRALTEPPTADPVVAAYFLFHDCDLAALRYGLDRAAVLPRGGVRRAAAGASAARGVDVHPAEG